LSANLVYQNLSSNTRGNWIKFLTEKIDTAHGADSRESLPDRRWAAYCMVVVSHIPC